MFDIEPQSKLKNDRNKHPLSSRKPRPEDKKPVPKEPIEDEDKQAAQQTSIVFTFQ